VLQDLAAKLERHERGIREAEEILFQHFAARHQVSQVDRPVLDFAAMNRRSRYVTTWLDASLSGRETAGAGAAVT
jgi:hypothetical protein